MEFFAAHRPCPLSSLPTLAEILDAQNKQFLGVTFVEYPNRGYLTFCEKAPPVDTVDSTYDSTVLVSHDLANRLAVCWPKAKLVRVSDPRATFIDTLEYLQREDLIRPSSLLPEQSAISPDARIGKGAIIEDGVQIDIGVVVGHGAVIRAGTWLKRGAVIGDNCAIGGSGINAYVGRDSRRRGFPHVAGVIVGENASLGAGCVVARGILSSTRIGADCIFGGMCNIGHGVEIGENVWISVGTMIGGHTHIGSRATIAMGCVIRDNVTIGDNASVGMGSIVTKSIGAGVSVFGNPARRLPSVKAGPSR